MGKMAKFTGGILIGAAAGIAAALLLAPEQVHELQNRVTTRLAALQEEARRAAEAQRQALEVEIARLRGEFPGNDL